MDISTDHKPNLPDESRRIQNAGGRVTRDRKYFMCAGQKRFQTGSYRVNGGLAMSRSIGIILFDSFWSNAYLQSIYSLHFIIIVNLPCISGDFNFKSNCLRATEQMVTCNPDIRTVSL
jgi:hypothetical protein